MSALNILTAQRDELLFQIRVIEESCDALEIKKIVSARSYI